MATSATAKANKRRDALRSRLDRRYPLFADQFYARDLAHFHAWFSGQAVPAPSHPRRKHRRPIDKAALRAFQTRQLRLLDWHRPANDNTRPQPTWLTIITNHMPWPRPPRRQDH